MKNLTLLSFMIFYGCINAQTIESNMSSITAYYHNSLEAQKAEDVHKSGTSIIPLALNVNTKEKQLDIRNSYLVSLNSKKENKKVELDLNFGISIGGKIDNTISSIFKDNNVVGGFKGGGMIALRIQQSSKVFYNDVEYKELLRNYHEAKEETNEKNSARDRLLSFTREKLHNATYWVYIGPSFEGRKFINIDSLNSATYTRKQNSLTGISCGITTFQNDLPMNFMGLLGVSYTLFNGDNFAALDEVSSYKQYSTSTSGNKQLFTAYSGLYDENVNSNSISVEAYLVNKVFSLFGFYLNPVYEFSNTQMNAAFNLNYTVYFLSPKISVFEPNFGLLFSHQDITHDRDDLFENNKSRFSIGIVTKMNIGNWLN